MKLIAVVDMDWGIGYEGNLLFSLPPDLQRFKQLTQGGVVVMGRKTAESLPKKQPLKNRVNIVLSRRKEYKMDGATVVSNLIELEETLNNYADKEIFVIGGAEIYKLLINFCDTAHITVVKQKSKADCFMVDLDKNIYWQKISESETMTFNGLEYKYVSYQRIKNAI